MERLGARALEATGELGHLNEVEVVLVELVWFERSRCEWCRRDTCLKERGNNGKKKKAGKCKSHPVRSSTLNAYAKCIVDNDCTTTAPTSYFHSFSRPACLESLHIDLGQPLSQRRNVHSSQRRFVRSSQTHRTIKLPSLLKEDFLKVS